MYGYTCKILIFLDFTHACFRLELALEHPVEHGVVKSFCRVKGHGFIKRGNGEDIFVHVSEYEITLFLV